MPDDRGAELVEIALRVVGALDELGIAYFLGGSLASSIDGEPRATNDIDLVVDMRPEQAVDLRDALGDDFVVDEIALRDSLRCSQSMNIFYLPLVTKIDLFPVGRSEFDRSEFSRGRLVPVTSDGRTMVVKTPEDSILRKLLWYVEGGGVSDSQWRDVVGLLRINAQRLDTGYLDGWAARLGLADLLERARAEAQAGA